MALLAVLLMVLGTCMIAVALPLQLWNEPEEPPLPVAPDVSTITDSVDYTAQWQAYNDAMEIHWEDQEKYEEEMMAAAIAKLLSLWLPWIGLCCLAWGMYIHTGLVN